MSKVLTLNGVKVTDTMIMYAISGSTLYVMLEYLNPLGTSGVLLEVTDYTYANLLTDTEFAQVNRTGGTYLVNPYRVKKIASNVITFDNGMTITTTSTDSDALNAVNDAMVVDGVPYTGATTDLDMGTHNVLVADEAYGAGWDASLEVPTKNAVYDKIQAIPALTDGDKGDITVTASGATWTIDNDVVTNAKLANMATKTYKGRTSALTGDPEDVPVSTLKTDLVLVKADVGLGNVDNTSDLNKPISTATQASLDLKLTQQQIEGLI